MAYDALARFYDAVHGERVEATTFLRSLLAAREPRSVLELACGTGAVLAQLRDDYEVAGVDLSREMLELAAAKLPGVELVHGDMTDVRLGRTFDAVICVYDSINHLLRFEDWERAFDTALAHLVDDGVFVLDLNTEERLTRIADSYARAQTVEGGHRLVVDVTPCEGGVFDWHLELFEHVGGDEYRRLEETIPELAVPLERVEAALAVRFAEVERIERDGGRVFFVCAR